MQRKNHLGNLIKNKPNDYHYEYLRIKGEESEKNNDYYKRNRCDYSNWSLASRTYGKYVMYYEWLKGLGKPTLPVTSLGENNISATEKKEKPLLEIINEIPDRAKKHLKFIK